jgi:KTSC domain-containing protein
MYAPGWTLGGGPSKVPQSIQQAPDAVGNAIAGMAVGGPAAIAVGKIPFVPQAAKAVWKAAPYIAASEAINYARQNLPGGKYIPPGSEMIPWFMSFGKGGEAPKAPEPGAPLPAKPSQELLQSRGLATGAQPAPPEPSVGLGKLPVYPQEVAPSAIPRAQVSQALDRSLQAGVGNKPLQPNVPLRLQGRGAVPTSTPEAAPAESSAIRSYRYDPAAGELHVTDRTGTTYVYGEVTQAQADAFHNAPSKGQAWQSILQNNTRVAKISPGGTRTPSKGASAFRSASPEDVPASDLSPQLKERLRQALARRKR